MASDLPPLTVVLALPLFSPLNACAALWLGLAGMRIAVAATCGNCEAQSLGWQQYLCTVVCQGEFVHLMIASNCFAASWKQHCC